MVRRAALVAGILFLLTGPAFAAADPAALKAVEGAGWRLDRARHGLPPLQLRAADVLEVHDLVEFAYEGGALRLIAGPDGLAAFAMIVDLRNPHHASYSALPDARGYDVYRDAPYVAVLRDVAIEEALFARLRSRRWTEEELFRALGPPSSRGHWHGMGCFELTWVPQGLLFVGDRTTGDAPLEYQLSEPSEGQDACLGPLDAISALDYATTRAEVRQRFARKLLRDRRTIDAALDEGRPSPDGRFTVGSVNLGGTYNNEQVVIRERGLPERRYPAGYFTRPDDYAWLDERTVLYRVRQPTGDVEFHSLDALTGTKRLLAEIPAAAPSRVAEFGVGARDRFWYRTEDGQRHEVPVGAGK